MYHLFSNNHRSTNHTTATIYYYSTPSSDGQVWRCIICVVIIIVVLIILLLLSTTIYYSTPSSDGQVCLTCISCGSTVVVVSRRSTILTTKRNDCFSTIIVAISTILPSSTLLSVKCRTRMRLWWRGGLARHFWFTHHESISCFRDAHGGLHLEYWLGGGLKTCSAVLNVFCHCQYVVSLGVRMGQG